MQQEHFDVVIVGAGLSGIGSACHLQTHCPGRSYVILEGRGASGGTWDLFRYPGIRSDSDMYTLGYSFKPWTDPKAIADGPSILKYVRETATEHGVDPHIRYDHMVKRASWSSEDARWTVEAESGGETRVFTCGFLHMCSGYYSYEAGYTPEFPGIDRFEGRVVHPQKWTDDIDYAGKRVVIIGSGATAVTLLPEMARTAEHVTMLQRSPTYMVSSPDVSRFANTLRRFLPSKLAYGLTRFRNVLLGLFFFQLARRRPKLVKRALLRQVARLVGREYTDEHFTPSYNPWDQRICLVPNGDLFEAINEQRASVVTDHIETFTEDAIVLKSGQQVPADLIVTATGLELVLAGNLEFVIDGEPTDLSEAVNYKGMMFSGVPNMASSFGYTNASWTLKCDLTCGYVCRLLNHMEQQGFVQCTPRQNDPDLEMEEWLDFTSGYIQRARDKFPKQGAHTPWRAHQNYFLDVTALKLGGLDDGVMEFR